MKNNISFKERVKNVAIENSKIYEKEFVEYEYLLCSESLANKYFIMRCEKGNFKHLLGVHTELTPDDFFIKCTSGNLDVDDFDFNNDKQLKGTVRQKIKVIGDMMNMFKQQLYIQENFIKNKVSCAIGTLSGDCTIGYVKSGRPKTLLNGNQLDSMKIAEVDLVIRKKRTDKYFDEIIFGDSEQVVKYEQYIAKLIDIN